MDERNHKSPEEWKKLINTISPTEFQNLCYSLINNRDGFVNPSVRGPGGDGGRDIEAEFVYKVANEEIREKCWFQCKRYTSSINFGNFSTEVQKADDQDVKKFFIISNADTAPKCKDDIKNWNNKHKCQIYDWTGLKFLDILHQSRDICRYYFPDEEVPPVVDAKKPGVAIELSSDVAKRFGLKLEFKAGKQFNPNNPSEVADVIKEGLLNLKNADINILALLYQKISMFFFSIERTEDALMFLNRSLDITPKNVEALLNKGFILERTDELDESNKCYDEILEIDSNNIFALNNKAHNLRRLGRYKEALKLADKALYADPNFIFAILNKVEVLKDLKKSKEALAFLEEKADLIEKSVNLQEQKVLLYIEMLDLKKAYDLNEDILKRDTDNLNAINNKGVVFEINSKFQKTEKYLPLALECFEKVVMRDNRFPLGLSNKTAVLIRYGLIDDAEKIADEAYTLLPKNAHVLNRKGAILHIRGKPKEALKYFDKALRLWSKEDFLLNRAQAQLDLNHWEEAKNDAMALLNYNPKRSEAWAIKGEALKHLRKPGVKTCFENAEKFKEKPISLLE
ncbi:Beta-barrel assembly-enhancing protease [uncultured archaeon]|nr:Beta-barrel assembly-enhancing protease [uncultured archaeon]